MIRRLPIIPTIIVAARGRGDDRARRLAAAARASGRKASSRDTRRPRSCRRSPCRRCRCSEDSCRCSATRPAFACKPIGQRAIAGENRSGEPGYVQIVDCATGAEGPGMAVELGWSKNPNAKVNWRGGPVSGIIAPDRAMRMRLVAASAPPGLEPSAPPSLDDHPQQPSCPMRVQWFAFAAIALIIYGLAVRKRLKEATQAMSGEMHILANGLTRRGRSDARRGVGLARALCQRRLALGAGGAERPRPPRRAYGVQGRRRPRHARACRSDRGRRRVAQRLDRARPDGVPRPRRWPATALVARTDRRSRPRARISTRSISSARSR